MTRPQIVLGNWKMNLSRTAAVALARSIATLPAPAPGRGPVVGVLPSAVHLSEVISILADSAVTVGAQDCAAEPPGAYTGGTSASQLAELGLRWVLVGHSERRQHFGEPDALIATKFLAAARAGLQPVLCIGETLAEREAGRTPGRICAQIDAALPASIDHPFVIAYEPVWAIGTGVHAGLEEVAEVHALIRERLDVRGPDGLGARTPILYGGSVTESNARGYLDHPEVDGALVGGASLEPARFAAICAAGAFPGI